MSFGEFATLFILAAGLAMDAFAVAVCKGLAISKITWKDAVIVGLWFGGFQALMPVIGYLLGVRFRDDIVAIDHWIAFGLLGVIGFNMIREASKKTEKKMAGEANDSLSAKSMFVMALATSIDALAIGVTFAFLNQNMPVAVSLIGGITFGFSVFGVWMGNLFGAKYKAKAEVAGGVILICLGVKILLEHLGVV